MIFKQNLIRLTLGFHFQICNSIQYTHEMKAQNIRIIKVSAIILPNHLQSVPSKEYKIQPINNLRTGLARGNSETMKSIKKNTMNSN